MGLDWDEPNEIAWALSLPVTWTTNAAVASGQFSLWVVNPANGRRPGDVAADYQLTPGRR